MTPSGIETPDQARRSAMPQPIPLPRAPTDMRDKVKLASKALYLLRMPNISETCWDVEQRNEALKRGTFIITTQRGEQKKSAPA